MADRFPALTPIAIRKEKANEVFLLFERLTNYQEKQEKQELANGDTVVHTADGRTIIRRPATTWF